MRVEDGAYAHVVLPAMLAQTNLDDRDRAFATELVYGTVRSQRRLDDLLGRVLKRPVHRLDPPVRAALRLGAYQLLHDTPPHAAVASTVDAVGARSPRARGFVNANLRALTRLPQPWPEPDERRGRALVPRLVGRAPHRRARRAATPARRSAPMNEPAAVTLRPDPRQVTVDRAHRGARARPAPRSRPVAWCPTPSIVRGVGDPGRLAAVRDGRATPQDQGSQAIVTVLAPEPGERIADLAAAPGGKATAIAERVGADGAVVALDVDAGRVRMIDSARHRIGLPQLLPGRRRRPRAAARPGDVRPRAARRAVQRHRRAAPSARRALAPAARGDRRARRAPARAARRRRAARAARRGARVLRVHAHRRRRPLGVDEWAAERAARASPRSPPPGAPVAPRTVAARSSCRRPPAPTACSSSPSAAPPDRARAPG